MFWGLSVSGCEIGQRFNQDCPSLSSAKGKSEFGTAKNQRSTFYGFALRKGVRRRRKSKRKRERRLRTAHSTCRNDFDELEPNYSLVQ